MVPGASIPHSTCGCAALGIKDSMFKRMEGDSCKRHMDVMDSTLPMIPVEPAYARKLLRDLAAWSKTLGVAPHRDITTVDRIFGEVNADAGDAAFQFGRQGSPLLIGGPNHSPIRLHAELIEKFLAEHSDEAGPEQASGKEWWKVER